MKKLFGILGVVVVVLLVLFFRNGFGLGGSGTGTGTRDLSSVQEGTLVEEDIEIEVDTSNVIEETIKKENEIESNKQENEETMIYDDSIITIKETQVFVGNKEFFNEEELKKYIEEINYDEKEFQLNDENSILETYEWVMEVLESLKITVTPMEKE